MAKRRYPVKKFILKVKMRCDYYPDPYKRCSKIATIIKLSDEKEGKSVIAYCADCFKDFEEREGERKGQGID